MMTIPPDPRLRRLTVALTAASALCLFWSLCLPTLTFQKLASEQVTYSIFGGIRKFWTDGSWFLASIVFAFSLVLPIVKLVLLAWVCLRAGKGEQREDEARVSTGRTPGVDSLFAERCVVRALRIIGKWSMLDVFIVTVFVGAIRFGPVASAGSRPGILVFAVAVLLSLFASTLASRLVGEQEHAPARLIVWGGGWPGRFLAVLAAVGFAASLYFPLVHLSKGILFQNAVVLPVTSIRLAREDELTLALGLMVFVIVATGLRILLSLMLRWFKPASGRLLRSVLLLDEWAMLDVFTLGLVVVYFKLAQLTTANMRVGFWVALATAILINLDSWLLRREMRERASVAPEQG